MFLSRGELFLCGEGVQFIESGRRGHKHLRNSYTMLYLAILI